MMQAPQIRTALPQRRYRYGDFGVTVLGDIESGDGADYRWVAAFVREGEAQPGLFVIAERLPPGQRADGSHALRIVSESLNEVMDTGDRWAGLDDFVTQALEIGAQLLSLEQETPYPL